MLGRSEKESGAHARAAVALAGWARAEDTAGGGDDELELLDLGSTSATLATVSRIEGLRAVVHVGHPQQPSHELELALLAADPSLLLTDAVAVDAQWVWVGRSAQVSGPVVVDEAGMRDCRHVLRSMGAAPRLVPSRTSIEERIDLAGPDGTLVVERGRVPAGWTVLDGSARLSEGPPVWYGLVESRAEATIDADGAQVWLAFGPRDDHRGSLQQVLGIFADADVDLDHLRSHPSQEGPHVFFASFTCASPVVLDALIGTLVARGVEQRVLAVLSGREFVPSPLALSPRWADDEPQD